jgi:kinesin family protein 11
VSEVSSDIYDTRVRENKILQRELSNMQKASSNAKEGLSKYVEKLERHFMEDTFSVAESKAVMENLLQEWYALVFFFFFIPILSACKRKFCEYTRSTN